MDECNIAIFRKLFRSNDLYDRTPFEKLSDLIRSRKYMDNKVNVLDAYGCSDEANLAFTIVNKIAIVIIVVNFIIF